MARNGGAADGAWHSFAPSRGFVGGGFRPGFGFRGGWGGRGGFGWRGGWGWGWGFGGWGWGWGWPYWSFWWGPGWGWGYWNPWLYEPYWYAPWPMYNPDYYNYLYNDNGYSDDDVRPPYRRHDDGPANAPGSNKPSQSPPPASNQNDTNAQPTSSVSTTITELNPPAAGASPFLDVLQLAPADATDVAWLGPSALR